ncbi:DNA polymerase IV [Tanticharoenia sakaeratensis NBRC 103193]|jgi:DNA polymerase IV|nr:DNA polymerase IV [Tanticharoenia sakaeratensis NBRC 103193]
MCFRNTGQAMADDSTSQRPDPPVRRIIHIDMDAFYASVEQRDDPTLRGRPLAVGSGEARGVVAAASYEARRFGVRSAMASVTARRRCPDLVFVRPRFDAYRAVSQQVHAIFARYTPLIQPLSLDEAYLDVTDHLKGFGSATEVAQAIRRDILAETGLTASAGVSYNRFLAKLASDHRKPDGLFVITPRMGPAFAAGLAVGKFHGIGPATAAKMHALGIHTGADLRARSLDELQAHFGRIAPFYYGIARGIDERPVSPDRLRKSLGSERTFSTDLKDFVGASDALLAIATRVWAQSAERSIAGRTVTLKVKYDDFRQITRARSDQAPPASAEELHARACGLAEPLFPSDRGVRLLGITLSALVPAGEQAPVTSGQLALALDL